MKKIKVGIKSNSYEVIVGSDLVNQENLKRLKGKEVLLVADEKVPSEYKNSIIEVLSDLSSNLHICEIHASEENKDRNTLDKIHSKLINEKFSRDCYLVALGGGITCDITGFAAATYQRGVSFILFPTTLLSQVDASVGGKTAINHPLGKNMIGAFHQPIGVFADIGFLDSLPKKEISDGLSEVIKHALIADSKFFDWLEKYIEAIITLEPEALKHTISRSIEIKSEIVSKDEKESGIRKVLNFGHTFGHAIELYGEFKQFSHGQSVALGMLMAMELSKITGSFKDKDLQRAKSLINKINPQLNLNIDFEDQKLIENMSVDKKRIGDKLVFILLEEIGVAKIKKDISVADIATAITSLA